LPYPRVFHSKEIPSFENHYLGQNIGAWQNNFVDSLLEKLMNEFNQEIRKELMKQIVNEYLNEVPSIPLYFHATIAIIPKNLKGFSLYGNSMPSSLSVENWSL
jgi:peptide/nickel transport system substrate-binding protein